MRKLAVIGDSHGNFEALKAVLEDAQRERVTDYIVLGDITNRGPEPNECVQALQAVNPLVWIIGNHEAVYHNLITHTFTNFEDNPKAIMAIITSTFDYQQLGRDHFEWLAERPIQEEIEIEDLKFNIFHSTPTECRGHFSFPTNKQTNFDALMSDSDADVGIYGHTHRYILRMTSDGRYLFNPGSVGMPVSDKTDISGKASYGIITIEGNSILGWQQKNIPYDLDKELAIARKREIPYYDLYAELLKTGKFTFNQEKVMTENLKKDYLTQALQNIEKINW
ncbi:metallophosphoesterase family protein [Ligilactobacillus cholophilus]|uniref:metallophosphoesterase family protein n=1 Tax=Ligilactobacillus cholophilus TaxID=3050131 RepID=UPI0025B20F1C|nr:metallophosphoesterase family protein [Ligilactobacillus cholophilus]